MTTYILQSGNSYKIGKTKELSKRMATYNTHNCNYKLIVSYPYDIEKDLHNQFASFRTQAEWFSFPSNMINFFLSEAQEKAIIACINAAPHKI